MTFKHGSGTRHDARGRFFNDQTRSSLAALVDRTDLLDLIETHADADLIGRDRAWVSALARRRT